MLDSPISSPASDIRSFFNFCSTHVLTLLSSSFSLPPDVATNSSLLHSLHRGLLSYLLSTLLSPNVDSSPPLSLLFQLLVPPPIFTVLLSSLSPSIPLFLYSASLHILPSIYSPSSAPDVDSPPPLSLLFRLFLIPTFLYFLHRLSVHPSPTLFLRLSFISFICVNPGCLHLLSTHPFVYPYPSLFLDCPPTFPSRIPLLGFLHLRWVGVHSSVPIFFVSSSSLHPSPLLLSCLPSS